MKGRLYDHPRFERCLPVSSSPQGLSKVPTFLLERQILCLPRPLFWLKYHSKVFFTKLLKPVAAHLRKQGVRMILDLDVFLILGSPYQEVQRDGYRYSSLGKPRFHSKSGKVVSNPNATNNISGFCNQLLP